MAFPTAVLANMRGDGEPSFEHDFAGVDMFTESREEPKEQERFEVEIASRLYGFRHGIEENWSLLYVLFKQKSFKCLSQ